jgi:hypothetical protein
MNYRSLAAALLIACTLGLPPTANAQRRSAVTLDASIGLASGGTSGQYLETQPGLSADALLALARSAPVRGMLVGGISAGIHGTGASTMICPAVPGGCMPVFPDFQVAGLLVGWQNQSGTLRLMGGPSFAWADWKPGAAAVQGRFDAAIPVMHRIALVASLRGTLIPNLEGDTFRLFAAGVGFRLH